MVLHIMFLIAVRAVQVLPPSPRTVTPDSDLTGYQQTARYVGTPANVG